MRVRRDVKPLSIAEDSSRVRVTYANRGEPFRDGVALSFEDADREGCYIAVLLDAREVKALRNKLSEFLGET